jgi:hypothetical protein
MRDHFPIDNNNTSVTDTNNTTTLLSKLREIEISIDTDYVVSIDVADICE